VDPKPWTLNHKLRQAFTCRLPAGRASAAARVDGALDRGLPKWIGTMVPHAPVETMVRLRGFGFRVWGIGFRI